MIRSVLVFVAAAVVACAPPAASGGSRDSNLITREEIAASLATNAYDAVRNLRPMFLRSRGGTTFDLNNAQTVIVFLDGHRQGDTETLRRMSTASITSIRFLSPAEATNKHGLGYPAGIIEVTTR